MFTALLVANRGEIACRVIRTARAMGVRTVAVYSEADADAAHVALADEAHAIGPPPAAESYLAIERLIDVARRAGAEAVHPGYGFLAENADFAEACAAAGLVFVGPPAAVIRRMGDKAAGRAAMRAAGVPVVPGYDGTDQDDATLAAAAAEIGFPLVVKPAAGGGGKGMRVVARAEDLAAALAAARREARSAFADDRLIVERAIARPRHVEVQVFADAHGHVIHLFERDCSVQRRHQKVIEEAPAPALEPALASALREAAVRLAASVGYRGAGTVEFLLADDGAFHAIEMNTRLQVEHPVTEAITGLDLVEWQLRVAAGEPLPLKQDAVIARGHAIEARLYAEDPAAGFRPAPGRLVALRWPAGVRIDGGVRAGDVVTPHYDPLLAKIVAHGPDRAAALGRLAAALSALVVVGPRTNAGFLARLAHHPAIAAGRVDTGFVEREAAALIPPREPAPDWALAAAALDRLAEAAEATRRQAAAGGDPHSPWALADGWRLVGASRRCFAFADGGREAAITLVLGPAGAAVEGAAGPRPASLTPRGDGDALLRLGETVRRLTVVRDGAVRIVAAEGRQWRLAPAEVAGEAAAIDVAGGRILAPMPGRIAAVMVGPGERVAAGAPLVVLEAMKMEHTVAAPAAGVVAGLACAVGDQVEDGAELVTFEDPR